MPTVDKRGKVTSSGIEKAGTPLQSPAGIKNDKEKKKVGMPANGHKWTQADKVAVQDHGNDSSSQQYICPVCEDPFWMTLNYISSVMAAALPGYTGAVQVCIVLVSLFWMALTNPFTVLTAG